MGSLRLPGKPADAPTVWNPTGGRARPTTESWTSGVDVLSRETKLHHVGIVVPDLERIQLLLDLLGMEVGHTQYVPQYEADCYFTRGQGSVIEFVVPRGGILQKFNKGFGGLHHIAIEVDDIESRSAELRAEGVELLEEKAVDAGWIWINFLTPASTRGLIVEIVQPKAG
jgi:methylmalonyl-CoA epimerase